MSDPVVSLLLQSYNHSRFLAQSVGTALDQTFPDKEIWVVDDGSTDDSHGVLTEWSSRAGFRYDRQPNQGLIATLNRMIDGSRGEFVALQATDDFWHPEKTARQIAFLRAHPEVDVCLTATVCVDADGKRLGSASQQFLSASPSGYAFEALFTGKTAIPCASALFRRSALEKYGPYDPSFPVEDFWFWLRLSRGGGTIAFLPEELTYYRLHGSNLHARTAFMEREILKIVDSHVDHPLHSAARKRWVSAFFSEWTLSDKREALKRLAHVSFREDQTWKGIAKLMVPARLWKRWKRV